MASQEQQKIDDYIDSIQGPAELSFLTDKQLETFKLEKQRMESSRLFFSSIFEKDNFEELLQKATIEGRLLSPSQVFAIDSKVKALEEGDGNRVDTQESLVSKSGQRVIMGGRLQKILGFITDGYMTQDELPQLTSALQSDGIPGPEIDKVTASMNKFGAVLLQRGVFIALKSTLEEAIGHTLSLFMPAQAQSYTPAAMQPSAAASSGDELPAGFIEYLKNSDKEFDRVEAEVMKDPMFKEFFANLQKHYAYYQKLPADQMAHEIMLRPQLWSKLSPQPKVWVQNIVDRNRAGFQAKVSQVASAAGSAKLDELKKTLAK